MEKKSFNLLQKKLDALIAKALEEHVFTACSVGFFRKNLQAVEGNIACYGVAADGRRQYPVDGRTVFDLASLTKPLVTSLCILALIEEEKLETEDRLDKFFEKIQPDKKDITLRHLLTHSSGLPAHRPYYHQLAHVPLIDRPEMVTNWILTEDLLFKPGTENVYSDLGFILLGRIIEKVSGMSLDVYWQRKILLPLGLEKGLFFAGKRIKQDEVYVPTGRSNWSKMMLCGTVHDDNCRALGGVAGHAGLFGTVHGVLSLCENILLQFQGERRHPSYSLDELRCAMDINPGPWVVGFDTPTAGQSSSGNYFSKLTIGHLGFTGTSFWIDLQQGICVVFLTNRVISGEELEPIRNVRPILHDTIMKFLLKKSG